MKKLLFVFAICLLAKLDTIAQGCVAIRSNGASCTGEEASSTNASGWQLNTNYRYFHSYKHFVGKVEQKEREEKGTDVRNWQHALTISVVRKFNNRWSMTLDVPVLVNTRSSMYEHYGNTSTNPNARRKTYANGLGDVRVAGNYWLFDPSKYKKGNVQVGLGIKLATGNYNVQDLFWKNDSTYAIGPVDQSIQLGDGGTGFTTEMNAYFNFTPRIGVYGNAYYLFNPREQNGVSTTRGGTASATTLKYFTATMSVPDQFMFRAGAHYNINKLMASAGLRVEGIPAKDAIGGSKGFRRPGYVVSIEPVVAYHFSKFNAFVSVPVAVERNRTQSYSDLLRSADTGTKVQGDAASSNYSINWGLSFKL